MHLSPRQEGVGSPFFGPRLFRQRALSVRGRTDTLSVVGSVSAVFCRTCGTRMFSRAHQWNRGGCKRSPLRRNAKTPQASEPHMVSRKKNRWVRLGRARLGAISVRQVRVVGDVLGLIAFPRETGDDRLNINYMNSRSGLLPLVIATPFTRAATAYVATTRRQHRTFEACRAV